MNSNYQADPKPIDMDEGEDRYPASFVNDQQNGTETKNFASETRWIPASGRSEKPNNCWYSLRFFQRQIILGLSLLVAIILFAIFMYILYA